MSAKRRVKIRGVAVQVPDAMRLELAEDIAERLTRRHEAIEEEYGRVDSVGYAMQLAFDAATQLHDVGQHGQSDVAELVKALSQLNEEIEKLLREG